MFKKKHVKKAYEGTIISNCQRKNGYLLHNMSQISEITLSTLQRIYLSNVTFEKAVYEL